MELLARVRSHAAPAVLPPIVFPSYHFLWKKKNVKFFRELRVMGTEENGVFSAAVIERRKMAFSLRR